METYNDYLTTSEWDAVMLYNALKEKEAKYLKRKNFFKNLLKRLFGGKKKC